MGNTFFHSLIDIVGITSLAAYMVIAIGIFIRQIRHIPRFEHKWLYVPTIFTAMMLSVFWIFLAGKVAMDTIRS